MRRAVLLLALAPLLTSAAAAAGAPPPPGDLEVAGGGDWQPTAGFDVGWRNVAGDSPVAAVHYLVRNPDGTVETGPVRIGWPAQRASVRVARTGASTIEVWLEDTSGAQGAPAAAKLRYDPLPPPSVEPLEPLGWISRTEIPFLFRVSHPAWSPVSGIRGYAISIDGSADGSPCARADVCSEDETDLRGGVADDALEVDRLSEGVLRIHAVAVSGSGVRSREVGSAVVRVDEADPVTQLLGAPAGWSSRPVTLEARAVDALSGMGAAAGGDPFTAIRVDGSAPVRAAGSTVRTTVIGEGVHSVAYYARDAAGNVDDGSRSDGQRNRSPAVAIVRIDRTPPSVAFVGSAGPLDPELLVASASDSLSGIAPDRGQIAVRRAGSREAFDPLPTAIVGERLLARWHSDEFPIGRYEFRATAFDAAGNSTTTSRRWSGAPMVLPNPVKARATLRVGLGRGPASARISFGRGVRLAGRLSASSDAPLAGLPVRIVERFSPGSRESSRTTLALTEAGGRFAVRLEPGPSREVTASFAGTGALTGTSSSPLALHVPTRVRLHASSAVAHIEGQPIVFSGRVAGARGGGPPDGVGVALQFRARGLPWSDFRTVRADRRGRFRYRYRFSDDDSRGVRFEFRATVAAQSDWPYEPGSSRPVAVRGI